MDELIAQLAAKAGVDRAVAKYAAGAILGFFRDAGPDKVQSLLDTIAGAETAIEHSNRSSGLNRLMGGGLMALGTRLMSFGLGMREIQNLIRELFTYGRDKIGADRMDAIIAETAGVRHFA